jgi:hypothetical protein
VGKRGEANRAIADAMGVSPTTAGSVQNRTDRQKKLKSNNGGKSGSVQNRTDRLTGASSDRDRAQGGAGQQDGRPPKTVAHSATVNPPTLKELVGSQDVASPLRWKASCTRSANSCCGTTLTCARPAGQKMVTVRSPFPWLTSLASGRLIRLALTPLKSACRAGARRWSAIRNCRRRARSQGFSDRPDP